MKFYETHKFEYNKEKECFVCTGCFYDDCKAQLSIKAENKIYENNLRVLSLIEALRTLNVPLSYTTLNEHYSAIVKFNKLNRKEQTNKLLSLNEHMSDLVYALKNSNLLALPMRIWDLLNDINDFSLPMTKEQLAKHDAFFNSDWTGTK